MSARLVGVVCCLTLLHARTIPHEAQPTTLVEDRPWMNVKLSPRDRAIALAEEMTVEEMISMLHGVAGDYVGNVSPIPRLGVPSLNLNDGPQGFRVDPLPGTSTSFPCGLAVGASFSEDVAAQWGDAMGAEFFLKGANVQLGPGMCLARVPVNGRNFEYLSGEDPFLGRRMVQPVIRGIQSQHVIANAKHYVNNNQETNRNSNSANVDERVEFEMYYQPFIGAVEAGVGSFMCSYNKINQVWACENSVTLITHLKQKIGFQGWMMSDWGATHSTSINQGLDQEMPGSVYMGAELQKMVDNGQVSVDKLTESVLRILTPMFQVGLFDIKNDNSISNNVTSPAHRDIARQIALESIVLLKNTNNLLPLSTSEPISIAVIGSSAASPITSGSGSGYVEGPMVASPLISLRRRLGVPMPAPNCNIGSFQNDTDFWREGHTSVPASSPEDCCAKCAARDDCMYFSFLSNTCYFKGSDESHPKPGVVSGGCRADAPPCTADGRCLYFSPSHLTGGVDIAKKADVAIVFVYTSSSEGGDRSDLFLKDDQDAMIQAIAAVQPNTIVVAVTPGALETQWAVNISSLLVGFMPGQEYGNAITDLIFGDAVPSGRLPVTFPNKENEVNFTVSQYPGADNGENSTYSEGLFIGYRWYDQYNVTPAFSFGHGLSYTSFKYSNLRIDTPSDTTFDITVNVANAGSYDAKEVVQLYLGYPKEAGEPPKVLRGFQKPLIKAGQNTDVKFTLTPDQFTIWDTRVHDWKTVPGQYKVFVGASSADIRLISTINVS